MKCSKCGGPLPRKGAGRPRKRCETCAPPRRKAQITVIVPDSGGSVYTATRDELSAAGREATPLGQAALVLAARIDANQDAGAAIAAMTKQLGATLCEATAGANVVASPVDELRARRAAKRA